MSDLMSDIGGLYGAHQMGNHTVNIVKKGSNLDLDMTDFITLMITQMTNQGIDDTMDTSEMLNQMVQMQMIQSMVNMTDATTMNYAASLVNKTVTVGQWTSDGLQEVVGNVDAVGTMDGQTVIFVKGKYYYLSDIMAIGDLSKADRLEEDDKADAPDIKPAPDLDPNFGVDHDVNVEQDPDLIPGFGVDQDPDGAQGAEGADQTGTTDPKPDGSSGANTNSIEG